MSSTGESVNVLSLVPILNLRCNVYIDTLIYHSHRQSKSIHFLCRLYPVTLFVLDMLGLPLFGFLSISYCNVRSVHLLLFFVWAICPPTSFGCYNLFYCVTHICLIMNSCYAFPIAVLYI